MKPITHFFAVLLAVAGYDAGAIRLLTRRLRSPSGLALPEEKLKFLPQ